MFIVEKNVPMVSYVGRRGRFLKYPFDKMEVSDSFLVPFNSVGANTKTPSVAGSAYSYGNHHGMKFSCKRDEHGNVRVWRIT